MTTGARKWRRSPGMLAYASASTWDVPCWRFQLYWPSAKLRTREIWFSARTVFRIIWDDRSRGMGVQVLGFGCGVSREARGVTQHEAAEKS